MLHRFRHLTRKTIETVTPVLKRNMLVTNTVTGAGLFTLGDLIQQRLEKAMGHRQKNDFKRTGWPFFIRTVNIINITRFAFRTDVFGRDQSGTAAPLLVHLVGPPFSQKDNQDCHHQDILRSVHSGSVFRHHIHNRNGDFGGQAVVRMLEGVCQKVSYRLLGELATKKNTLVQICLFFQFDWIIWPPTQYLNFRYIPQSFRVLYVNTVTVVWDVFLSYIKHHVRSRITCHYSRPPTAWQIF